MLLHEVERNSLLSLTLLLVSGNLHLLSAFILPQYWSQDLTWHAEHLMLTFPSARWLLKLNTSEIQLDLADTEGRLEILMSIRVVASWPIAFVVCVCVLVSVSVFQCTMNVPSGGLLPWSSNLCHLTPTSTVNLSVWRINVSWNILPEVWPLKQQQCTHSSSYPRAVR